MEFADGAQHESTDPSVRSMIPPPNLRFRLGLFAVLLILLAISPGHWTGKSIALLLFSFFTGSFRRAYCADEILHVQLSICFIPLKLKRYRLRKFHQIEIMLEQPAGWWTFFLFGPLQWMWSRMLDFALPWFGGLYQLWLTSGSRKVLVWQGCSDDDFEHNLKELQTATGLEVVRTGEY